MFWVCLTLWHGPCECFSTQVAVSVASRGGLLLEAEQVDDMEQQWSVDASLTPAGESRGDNHLEKNGGPADKVAKRGENTIGNAHDAANKQIKDAEDRGKASVKSVTDRVNDVNKKIVTNISDGLKKGANDAGGPFANQTRKIIDDSSNSAKNSVEGGVNSSKVMVDTAIEGGSNASSGAVNKSRETLIDAWKNSTLPFAALDQDDNAKDEGNPKAFINFVAGGIVAFVVASLGLGYAIDKGAIPSLVMPKGRPSAMTICLVATSYALLVPGLISVSFSFNIIVVVGDWLRLGAVKDTEGNASPCTESMLSLIHRLFISNNALGGCFILLYAILVPIFKVVALTLGEYWRCSEEEALVSRSRSCILAVHFISKWACPDMFAYILLLYLFRDLNQPPVLESFGHLDTGFAFFAAFCVLSTFASLGIRPPPKQPDEVAAPSLAPGTLSLQTAISGLTCMFWICLAVGVVGPCMCMRLDEEAFDQKDGGPADELAKYLVNDLNLIERMSADVSFLRCSIALARWVIFTGEVNMISAFVLLVGFAVVLPVWHMMVLLKVAYQLDSVETAKAEKPEKRDPQPDSGYAAIGSATVLHQIAMLDVCIMGVAVVLLCSGSYRENGLLMFPGYGLFSLLAAEVFRYASHYMVMRAAQRSLGDLPAGVLLRGLSSDLS